MTGTRLTPGNPDLCVSSGGPSRCAPQGCRGLRGSYRKNLECLSLSRRNSNDRQWRPAFIRERHEQLPGSALWWSLCRFRGGASRRANLVPVCRDLPCASGGSSRHTYEGHRPTLRMLFCSQFAEGDNFGHLLLSPEYLDRDCLSWLLA